MNKELNALGYLSGQVGDIFLKWIERSITTEQLFEWVFGFTDADKIIIAALLAPKVEVYLGQGEFAKRLHSRLMGGK